MPITLTCQCGKEGHLKDEYAGKRVKCPSCGRSIAVPLPTNRTTAASQHTELPVRSEKAAWSYRATRWRWFTAGSIVVVGAGLVCAVIVLKKPSAKQLPDSATPSIADVITASLESNREGSTDRGRVIASVSVQPVASAYVGKRILWKGSIKKVTQPTEWDVVVDVRTRPSGDTSHYVARVYLKEAPSTPPREEAVITFVGAIGGAMQSGSDFTYKADGSKTTIAKYTIGVLDAELVKQ